MLLLAVVLLKYALPLLAPFVIGFGAYLLKRPIRFASHKLHISRKAGGDRAGAGILLHHWVAAGAAGDQGVFRCRRLPAWAARLFTPRGWSLCS